MAAWSALFYCSEKNFRFCYIFFTNLLTFVTKYPYLCEVNKTIRKKEYAMKKQIKLRKIQGKALSIANVLHNQGWSFSDALRQGWKVAKAWAAMQMDEVIIRFTKEGEEIPEQRTATLSPAFFTYTSTSTKTRKENPLQVKYWDTLKNGWRSFNAARFVSFAQAELPF